MPFLVRLGTIGRSKDRYQWSPSDSHPSTFARLGNLSRNLTDPAPRRGQPYADSPPPYSQVQGVDRRHVAETVTRTASSRRGGDETRRSPQRAATAPLTTGNLASLNGGDGVHFKHRLSHVSQYPAQLLDSSTLAASSASSEIGADDFPQTPGRQPQHRSPVQSPPRSQRRPSARRPVSVASSSSTAAACMALGQLPGSEPFDLAPPSQRVLARHAGIAAQTSPPPAARSTTSWLDDARGRETVYETEAPAAAYETAQVMQVHSLISRASVSRNGSSTSVNRISLVSSTAQSLRELANAHEGSNGSGRPGIRPVDGGFPKRLSSLHAHPVIRTSRTWPTARQVPRPERRDSLQVRSSTIAVALTTAEPHPGHRVDIEEEEDRPPPPPPKDPGYVSRPPGQKAKQPRQASSQQQQQQQKRLRRHSSTPNLSSVGLGVTGVSLYSANDGELLLPNSQYSSSSSSKHNNHARTTSAPLGRRASARNRLGSLVQGGNRRGSGQQQHGHRRFFSLRTGGGNPDGDASFRERPGHDGSASPANRRAQMAVACARLLGRALPKSSVIKGA
jgi:hypothetical protein